MCTVEEYALEGPGKDNTVLVEWGTQEAQMQQEEQLQKVRAGKEKNADNRFWREYVLSFCSPSESSTVKKCVIRKNLGYLGPSVRPTASTQSNGIGDRTTTLRGMLIGVKCLVILFAGSFHYRCPF